MAARRYCWTAPAKSPRTPSASPTRIWASGTPGFCCLEAARALQRLVAIAAGEQSRDQPHLGGAVAGIVGGGAADGGEIAVAQRIERGERAGLRPRGAGEIERGGDRFALPRERAAHQRERIGVGVGQIGDRAEAGGGGGGVAHAPLGGGEQAPGAAVARLIGDQQGEALRRLLLIAGLEIDRGEQQQAGGRVVEGAVRAVPEAAGELEVARAGGEHRLRDNKRSGGRR